MPEEPIQNFGRWTSRAFQLYSETSVTSLYRLSMRFSMEEKGAIGSCGEAKDAEEDAVAAAAAVATAAGEAMSSNSALSSSKSGGKEVRPKSLED